jgi:branched-chain amino acid transport system substrate-binding protein
MQRARLIVAVGVVLLMGATGAVRPSADRAATQSPTDNPIRVGFMAPLSGPYAQTGRDILNGFLLYLEEIGYKASGRRIELLVEDDEAIPAVGLTKARKLVERDKVHLMTGALLSSTGYALAPYIDSMQIPMLYPVVSADDLTQRRRSKWIVRTGWSASQPNHAFGEYAHRVLKLKNVSIIALDYAFGWESVGGFQRTFEAEGGTIVQKIWCPVSVHDFAPYLAQVSRKVDAVYALFLGRSALQFMRQYQEFGLKERVLLIGSGTTTDEHVLPFMGDEASESSARSTTVRPSIPRQTGSSHRHTGRDTGKCRATMPRACIRAQSGSSKRSSSFRGALKTPRPSSMRCTTSSCRTCHGARWNWTSTATPLRMSTSGESNA